MAITCPHVTAAMVTAGFTVCATCDQPLARQIEALSAAYGELAMALDKLASEATTAAKIASRRRPPPTDFLLAKVYAAHRDVGAAEQSVDLATLDLHTAGGGDA